MNVYNRWLFSNLRPSLAPVPIQLPTLAPQNSTTSSPVILPSTTLAPKVNVCTTTYQVKTSSNVNLKMLCYVAGK